MSDQVNLKTRIWANDGSNVDLATHQELDEQLSSLFDLYDTALDAWRDVNEEMGDLRSEYLDRYAKVYDEYREDSDKITLIKKDVEMDTRIRKQQKEIYKAEGVKEYCEKVLKKIESQRSIAQSRVKLLLSQTQWDRSGPG
jgi:hypothetical protein